MTNEEITEVIKGLDPSLIFQPEVLAFIKLIAHNSLNPIKSFEFQQKIKGLITEGDYTDGDILIALSFIFSTSIYALKKGLQDGLEG